MKLLNLIKERMATIVPPAKLIEQTSPKGKGRPIQAPSITESCQRTKVAYEATMPLSLTSKEKVEETNEILKALKAKSVYKK